MSVVAPEPWRHKMVVAAAADYFSNNRVKGAAAALTLNALPIDHEATGRKSSNLVRGIIEDGWSLVVSRGWPLPRRLGPGLQGWRCVPVDPHRRPRGARVHRRLGRAVRQGPAKKLKVGTTKVVFGAPLWPRGERHPSLRRPHRGSRHRTGRRVADRLLDRSPERRQEAESHAHRPRLHGLAPPVGPERTPPTGYLPGLRRRQKRRWPDLGN